MGWFNEISSTTIFFNSIVGIVDTLAFASWFPHPIPAQFRARYRTSETVTRPRLCHTTGEEAAVQLNTLIS